MIDDPLQWLVTGAALIGLLMSSQGHAAEVYRSTTADGQVIYSDTPSEHSERAYLPALNAIPMPHVELVSPEEQVKELTVEYQLVFASPEPETTYGHEVQSVTVVATVTPPLQVNHRVQFFLNGQAQGEPESSLSRTFESLPRGAHQVTYQIIEQERLPNGRVKQFTLAKSKPLVFYQQRATILN